MICFFCGFLPDPDEVEGESERDSDPSSDDQEERGSPGGENDDTVKSVTE